MLRWSYRRQLISDEFLVKCGHRHWRLISRPLASTVLLVLTLLAILLVLFGSNWGRLLFVLVAVIGTVGWGRFALPPIIGWYADSYAVTSRRVLLRKGIIRQRYTQIDLVSVNNPTLDRSGLDRLFGSGTIELGGGRQIEHAPRVLKLEQLISQLAANQTKNMRELSRMLRGLGYTRLTSGPG